MKKEKNTVQIIENQRALKLFARLEQEKKEEEEKQQEQRAKEVSDHLSTLLKELNNL